MIAVFYIGMALALAGFGGILWFIHRTRRLRRSRADDKAVHEEFRSLLFLNVAAFGLAFLGLALAVLAAILGA